MTAEARLVAGLRSGTRDHDPHVRATVELLIDHDMWSRREEFVDRFVELGSREATIDFQALTAALVAGDTPRASGTETGILRLAADLATDRWFISRMGDANAHLVRVAIAAATE